MLSLQVAQRRLISVEGPQIIRAVSFPPLLFFDKKVLSYIKISTSDSNKMTLIWYQPSEQGWASTGNMCGKTGQPLLKSFSITEEREAIVR